MNNLNINTFSAQRSASGARAGITLGLIAGILTAAIASAHAQAGDVYTTTNGASANSVIKLHRGQNGVLSSFGTYLTGGKGTGSSLGSQSAIIVSPNHAFLYAVDAGTNDIAAFLIQPNGLRWISNTASGGTEPVSLTANGDSLYVLNAGGSGNISGFTIRHNGDLTAKPNSTQALSGTDTSPAQIAFSPDGEDLVVTEKATSKIDVFAVGAGGEAGPAVVTPSAGETPYGFAFDCLGRIVVTEAVESAASSYFVSDYGTLPITASEANGQQAACWAAVTATGYAYTANAGTSTLSGYAIALNGKLSLLPHSGVVATLAGGAKPLDLALDANQGYLYVLEDGIGAVAGYRIGRNGELTFVNSIGSLGSGLVGLAAL